MKKFYSVSTAIIVIILAIIIYKRNVSQTPSAEKGGSTETKLSPSSDTYKKGLDFKDSVHAQKAKFIGKPDPDDPRMTRTDDGYNIYKPSFEMSQTLKSSDDPTDQIDVISTLISSYKIAYKENPVAQSNAAVINALTGQNPMKVIFMDPNISNIINGELVDQWGTPYFFHAESSVKLEIRSAGQDLEMWTNDDVTGY